ncbi:MAG: transcriptional regulator [Oscillatoriales cyanobacterium SM2_1_8]|nr:transcriptional regulator [Oscillatoriales cyanobacterium SM2_1_8]
MSIHLTPEQEHFVQAKLKVGKYRSAEQILEVALQLLDVYDRTETEWVAEVRCKIEEALATTTPPVDGASFVQNILAQLSAKDRP